MIIFATSMYFFLEAAVSACCVFSLMIKRRTIRVPVQSNVTLVIISVEDLGNCFQSFFF